MKKPIYENPIVLREVTIERYQRKILQNVNIVVGRGELVYLTGTVGAGKSSLLEFIYGELPHSSEGDASVLGYNLKTIGRRQRQAMRRAMGIVFQSSDQLLYDRSVEGNLAFVLKAIGKESKSTLQQRIDAALEKVGMQGLRKAMPHELSGGEAERVCIARALIKKPELILLDEPTAGLDNNTALQIGKVIKEITEDGTAVVMTTHNQNVVKSIEGRVLRLDKATCSVTECAPETELISATSTCSEEITSKEADVSAQTL